MYLLAQKCLVRPATFTSTMITPGCSDFGVQRVKLDRFTQHCDCEVYAVYKETVRGWDALLPDRCLHTNHCLVLHYLLMHTFLVTEPSYCV